jgi:putative ABC transport system permease protein
MKISDLIEETYLALVSNKARSGLTILGIVIGIGSVIAMIAIGEGTQTSIKASIESLGSNLVMVMPGAQRGAGTSVSSGRGSAQTLTVDDSNAIRDEISLAKNVAPVVSGRYQITAKGTNTNTQVVGTTAEYTDVKSIAADQGTFFTKQQVTSGAKVAVLGPTTRDDLFGENVDPTGQTIKIKGTEFKVIGTTVSKGGSGFNNQDDIIYIPLSTAQRYFTGNDKVSTINVQAVDEKSMADLQTQITELLLKRHNIADAASADFSVMNQSDIVASASSITSTLTLLLGAIAGISLVVGGIGIMNMMLTNVTERTREIGLRKAIGAKKAEISLQFLTEAIMLTFLGGLIGIAVGWLVALGVKQFGNIATEVSMASIAMAFGVSALIGIIFGYYPAQRAAALNPIEALRYE